MAKLRLKKKVRTTLYRLSVLIILIVVVFFGISLTKGNDKQAPKEENNKNTVAINVDNKTIYLIKDEEVKIEYDSSLKYEVSNSDIISFNNGIIKGLSNGETKLTVSNDVDKKEIIVNVTDLLIQSTVNNSKSYLTCHNYSEEQASIIDKTLEYKINEKGYLTRAGAVEAARFLILNFPYKLKYFFENGRMDRSNSFFDYVDGEGRYYHKGLYLTDNKFGDLKASLRGPQPWGCSMYNDTTKVENPNGLDCSGFVTWAMVNAGYDPGDVGAGVNDYNDITDVGEIKYFNSDGAFENVKVGDLIGRKGHIAMLIGMEDNKYYVGEALDAGEYDMHVYSYSKEELIASHFEYFVYLDKFYKNDGNLTNMW